MHNQSPDLAPLPNPVQLHPLDQEELELTGSLVNLPLLVNPAVLDRLRGPPPSVHTIETKGRKSTGAVERTCRRNTMTELPDPEDRQDFTYRGYLLRPRMESYRRAREVYAAVDGSFGGKFSSRLGACRKFAWFVQSSITNKLRVQSSRCKLRWCPICRDVSRMIVTTAVEEWLVLQKFPKMITLTLEHSDDSLERQVKRIYDSFRKLRRRAYFQRLITGGVWFFQLKFNQTTEQWHPHIHCLVAGAFLPHKRLRSLWHEITGDSFIVDIRPVKDLDGCSNEVARYATSPADIAAVNLDRALEIFYATKGRRICGSWGSAKSITLKPTPLEDTSEWTKVADFFFINVKKEFDPAVRTFWKCFKQGKPYEGPQLQKLTDVYREELYCFESSGKEIIDNRSFIRMVTQGRDHDWKGFYDPASREEAYDWDSADKE
ncbi:MAG: protein rep, partial [Planctomycetes bacterium]|nr:protein rep [Planctomycetota bacterium]